MLWASYLRLLLCLSKSRPDSLGPGNQAGSFFLPIIYCQWWRCRGTYASRYSSFLGSPQNGLWDGPRLKGSLLIPHGSYLYTWNKLCLVLHVFLSYISLPSSVTVPARKPYILLRRIFILKAIFPQAYNKWPGMDETCKFWWMSVQVNISCYHCLLCPFSAFLPSF